VLFIFGRVPVHIPWVFAGFNNRLSQVIIAAMYYNPHLLFETLEKVALNFSMLKVILKISSLCYVILILNNLDGEQRVGTLYPAVAPRY
jgi:hypothetical protein